MARGLKTRMMTEKIKQLGGPRAQFALDFMISYGLVIITVAIAIYVIYELGVFNPQVAPSYCNAAPSLTCSSFAITTNGILTFLMSQSLGSSITITGIACSTQINSTGNGPKYGNVNLLGSASFYPTNGFTKGAVLTDTQPQVFSVYCYGSSAGIPINGLLGTNFVGYVWINYTYSGLPSSYAVVQQALTISTPFVSGVSILTTTSTSSTSTSTTSTSTTSTSTTTSVATTTVHYVPITLTNNQGTNTVANLPQLITVSSTTYSNNINSAWNNVEFTTSNQAQGSTLTAWIENSPTNTASATAVWVLLPNAIPGNSNTVIYMDFMPSTVLSSAGPTGEAPQLSCTTPSNTLSGCGSNQYAQYDNGANVFTFYDNFVGPSLSGTWNAVVHGPNNLVYTVSNGLYITATPVSSTVTVPSLANVVQYIPFNIITTATNSLAANTQILLTFPANSYQNILTSSMNNIVVANILSGATAPAWLEGNTANEGSLTLTANGVYIWVLMPDSVPVSSTDSNWAIFAANTATGQPYLGNAIAQFGEAPQLSTTYGQYDNGKNVFVAYFNGITNAISPGSFSFNSGLTVTTQLSTFGATTVNALSEKGVMSPAGRSGGFVFNAVSFPNTAGSQYVVEASVNQIGQNGQGIDLMDNAIAKNVKNDEGILESTGFSPAYTCGTEWVTAGTWVQGNVLGPGLVGWIFFTLIYTKSGSLFNAIVAPQLYSSSGGLSCNSALTNPLSGIATNIYMGQFFADGNAHPANILYNWERTRIDPSNGALPTITFGTNILTSSKAPYFGIISASSYAAPNNGYAVEGYFTGYNTIAGAPGAYVAETNSFAFDTTQPDGYYAGYRLYQSSASAESLGYVTQPTSTNLGSAFALSNPFIGGVEWLMTGKEIGVVNYTTTSTSDSTVALPGNVYFAVEETSSGTQGTIANVIWTRARIDPPNGIMPSVAFGNVV